MWIVPSGEVGTGRICYQRAYPVGVLRLYLTNQVDWLYSKTLDILHGHSNFSAISKSYDDFFNLDYTPVDECRFILDEERTGEGLVTYWFLELSQRCM